MSPPDASRAGALAREGTHEADALALARELRQLGGQAAAARSADLRAAAERDAARLHAALGSAGSRGGKVAAELYDHLRIDDLTGAIVRHAMLHAGLFVRAADKVPFATCPKCGAEL